MKRWAVILLILFFAASIGATAAAKSASTAPRLKDDGKKFRVIYIQGGPYYEYDQVFLAVIGQLGLMGWANKIKLPASVTTSAKDLYRYLAAHPEWSRYIEFPEDGFYDNDWKEEARKKTMERIAQRKDIDMVFAYGTWGGQDMKKMPAGFKVPVVVMDVSDALGAGIVDSNSDSGRDNLTARVDPLRYQRQIRLFNDIIGFKKLGMAFEDTVEGRSYAAIKDVEKVAKERDFQVITERHPGYVKSKEKAEAWLIDAVRRLAPKVDAFYLTQQLALDDTSLPKILDILDKHKVPTFSQAGTIEVKKGALLSIATSGFKYVAEYHAKKIGRILNGAKPRSLPLLFEDPAKIAINLKTAQKIGFDPPVDILGAADEIFTE